MQRSPYESICTSHSLQLPPCISLPTTSPMTSRSDSPTTWPPRLPPYDPFSLTSLEVLPYNFAASLLYFSFSSLLSVALSWHISLPRLFPTTFLAHAFSYLFSPAFFLPISILTSAPGHNMHVYGLFSYNLPSYKPTCHRCQFPVFANVPASTISGHYFNDRTSELHCQKSLSLLPVTILPLLPSCT